MTVPLPTSTPDTWGMCRCWPSCTTKPNPVPATAGLDDTVVPDHRAGQEHGASFRQRRPAHACAHVAVRSQVAARSNLSLTFHHRKSAHPNSTPSPSRAAVHPGLGMNGMLDALQFEEHVDGHVLTAIVMHRIIERSRDDHQVQVLFLGHLSGGRSLMSLMAVWMVELTRVWNSDRFLAASA